VPGTSFFLSILVLTLTTYLGPEDALIISKNIKFLHLSLPKSFNTSPTIYPIDYKAVKWFSVLS